MTINYANVIELLEGLAGSGAVIGDLTIADIIGSILGGSDETPITELAFGIDNFAFGATDFSDYNALNAGLINNSYGVTEPTAKVYNSSMGSPVLEPHVSMSTVDGKNYIDLFPGNNAATGDINYVYDKDGAGSLGYISASELENVSSYNVQYTYTDIYGVEQSAGTNKAYQTGIYGVSGLDLNSTEPQEVTFYITPMDGDGVFTQLKTLLSVIGMDFTFATHQVKAYVQINAELESVSAKQNGGQGGLITKVSSDIEVYEVKDGGDVAVYGYNFGGILFTQLNVSIKYKGIEEAKSSIITFAEDDLVFGDPDKIETVVRSAMFGGGNYNAYIAKGSGENSVTINTALGTFVWKYNVPAAE